MRVCGLFHMKHRILLPNTSGLGVPVNYGMTLLLER